LSLFETAIITLCLLPEIDSRYGALIGFLHDDVTRKLPSVEMALSLFAPGGAASLDCLNAFSSSAPLFVWRLVHMPQEENLIRQPLQLDRGFLWYLLGDRSLDLTLGNVARIITGENLARIPMPPPLVKLVATELQSLKPVLLYGEDEYSCLNLAYEAVVQVGRSLLVIDGSRLAEMETAAGVLQQCLREAVLKGSLPCVTSASTLLQHGSPRAEQCRQRLLACPLPPLLVSQSLAGEVAYAGSGVTPIAVPAPRALERLAQWHEVAKTHAIDFEERTLLALSETEGLTGAVIEEVATVAQATATAEGQATTGRHVQLAARSALRQRAPSLTVATPRFSWEDIVLPADRLLVLRHLCSRVRYRSQVQETWGMGRGTSPGVTALFAGLPGTGKSMAAEVIAADLGLDLCKIDLAQVVSKYIGETEKNLAKIFSEAEQCGVVLVFDEADALFGKRSDVKDSHDRYANIETSYLLQRMERYRGLAVLTTNLRANLDEAFTRRISVSIDFPMPGPADRLRLWKRAIAGAPCAPDLNLQELADKLEIAGGNIVNCAVAGAYLAAEERTAIDNERLLRGVRWELQKMGRLMSTEAMEALLPATAGALRGAR